MREAVRAQDLMVRPVRRVTSRSSVSEAAAFLLRSGVSGAPVEDEHGRWVGVFTLNDVARVAAAHPRPRKPERTLEEREPADREPPEALRAPESLQVREVMTPGMVTVFPDATLGEVVHAMQSFDVHRVFVLDEDQATLLGVITTMDVLRWLDACANGSHPASGQRHQPPAA